MLNLLNRLWEAGTFEKFKNILNDGSSSVLRQQDEAVIEIADILRSNLSNLLAEIVNIAQKNRIADTIAWDMYGTLSAILFVGNIHCDTEDYAIGLRFDRQLVYGGSIAKNPRYFLDGITNHPPQINNSMCFFATYNKKSFCSVDETISNSFPKTIDQFYDLINCLIGLAERVGMTASDLSEWQESLMTGGEILKKYRYFSHD